MAGGFGCAGRYLNASGAVFTGRDGVLAGWSMAEVAGTPALAYVKFRDGGVVGGNIIAVSKVGASGASESMLPAEGIRAVGGLYMEIVSGAVDVVVYTR